MLSVKYTRRFGLFVLALNLLGTTTGCAVSVNSAVNGTPRTQETATPDARPFDTITDFTESLQCMDDYLIRYKIKDLSILVVEDRDVTGQVVGAKDMAVTALSKMARKSKSIRVVSIAPAHAVGVDAFIAGVGDRVPPNSDRRLLPKYFITISMPQIDNAVSADRKSAGIRVLGAAGLEYDNDKLMSSMSIDLNMGYMLTASSLPGVYSSNTVAIKRTGKAIGSSGEINKLGAVFNVSTDRSEGFHHSLRQLVELGVIELVGRLTQLPYWECLNISTSNKPVQRQIQDWYESLASKDLITFTQNKLLTTGLYRGPIDGQDSDALRQAIARFRESNGMVPSANIDSSLFRLLLSSRSPIDRVATEYSLLQNTKAEELISSRKKALFSRTTPLYLDVDIGDESAIQAGQSIHVTLNSTVDSHIYCYYQQIGGKPIKIFPNRFRPGSKLLAQSTLKIPGADGFNILADKRGDIDSLMCMASYDNIENFMVPIADLQQIDNYPDLASVYAMYKKTAKTNGIPVPLAEVIRIKVN